MAYYPKNKIKTNLMAADGEYFLPSTSGGNSTQPYTGFYYKLYNGEAYTGTFPGDGENILLLKNTTLPSPDIIMSPTSTTLPPLYPTDKDYENGMFIRYFSKKRNEFIFKELTKKEYDSLNVTSNIEYTLYKPFSLKWMLVGFQQDILQYNFYSVKSTERKEDVLGLSEYLKDDYLKYSIIKINE
jgi:hypothetical protein